MPAVYPNNDAAFALWLGNFLTVAGANLAALGLTAADITALTALKTDLDAKLVAETAAREAAVAATAAKNVSRRNANVQASFRSKVILANPAIPAALKEQLGLRVRDTVPTVSAPLVPVGLVVEPLADGTNRLKWQRAGNSDRTQFIVEARVGVDGAWSMVGVTTKTRFDHTGQTPGVAVYYRIRARRGDAQSAFGNTAVAYA